MELMGWSIFSPLVVIQTLWVSIFFKWVLQMKFACLTFCPSDNSCFLIGDIIPVPSILSFSYRLFPMPFGMRRLNSLALPRFHFFIFFVLYKFLDRLLCYLGHSVSGQGGDVVCICFLVFYLVKVLYCCHETGVVSGGV